MLSTRQYPLHLRESGWPQQYPLSHLWERGRGEGEYPLLPATMALCSGRNVSYKIVVRKLDAIRHTGVTLIYEACELEYREKYPPQG